MSDYNYDDKIKKPRQIGSSPKGEWSQVTKNFKNIVSYTDVLVKGGGKAVKNRRPLGTKFFYDTQKTCTKDDGTECNQHLYFDTVPPPNEELRGTIPGAMYMFRKLDTDDIFSTFSSNSEGTDCVEVTLKTRNNDHVEDVATHCMTLSNASKVDDYNFVDGVNPHTQPESFQNYKKTQIPDDKLIKAYFASLSALGLYIVYCTLKKKC